MSQNLISLRIDANRFSAIDAAVTALEKLLDDFVELSVEQRRELLAGLAALRPPGPAAHRSIA